MMEWYLGPYKTHVLDQRSGQRPSMSSGEGLRGAGVVPIGSVLWDAGRNEEIGQDVGVCGGSGRCLRN